MSQTQEGFIVFLIFAVIGYLMYLAIPNPKKYIKQGVWEEAGCLIKKIDDLLKKLKDSELELSVKIQQIRNLYNSMVQIAAYITEQGLAYEPLELKQTVLKMSAPGGLSKREQLINMKKVLQKFLTFKERILNNYSDRGW